MALTPSTMLALGTKAPDFQLPDVISGQTISLASFAGKQVLVVMFICRHCHESEARSGTIGQNWSGL
jgi:peroxiredoxin